MISEKKVSILSCAVLIVLATAVLTSSIVHHVMAGGSRLTEAQEKFVINFAELPRNMWRLLSELSGEKGTSQLILLTTEEERRNWNFKFPQPDDDGYLLLSGYNGETHSADIRLIRIADNQVTAKWTPDWKKINERTSTKRWYPQKLATSDVHATHPIVLPGGDIIFNTGYSLARVKRCSSELDWLLDQTAHHSIHFAQDGKSIWVPGISEAGFGGNKKLQSHLRDDSLMRVSLEGKILENTPFSNVLLSNELSTLLYGSISQIKQTDPIHLNHIEEATYSTRFWDKGDLLISARHLNAILLYRPTTGKIVWYQHGPWLHQHSARFWSDSKIAILDNNVADINADQYEYVAADFINRVLVYDFATNKITEPFVESLKKLRPMTSTGGHIQVLQDDSLFFEESNRGRHFRIKSDRVLWSRINLIDENYIGLVAWSRYLTAAEGAQVIADLKRAGC